MDQPQEPTSDKKPFWPAPSSAPQPAPPPPPETEPVVVAAASGTDDDAASVPPTPPKSDDFREKMKPVVDNAKTVAKTAATQAAKMAEQGARIARPVVESWLHRCWLNLRVWVPQLANPDFRSRQIVYHASDVLRDGIWSVELAPQCWQSGATTGLVQKQVELPVRSYENPVQVVLGLIAALALFFLLSFLLTVSWWLYLIAFLMGLAVLRLKSWPEVVRVTYSAAGDLADEMPQPEAVGADGRLTLLVVDRRLAEATRKAIAAKRAAEAQARAAGGAPMSSPSRAPLPMDHRSNTGGTADPMLQRPGMSEPTPPTTPISNYKRDELPPLKLDE